MTKTIKTKSGHELVVVSVADRAKLPALQNVDGYPTLYTVSLAGRVVMYLGKGYADAPREIVAWYPNGNMWSSFGSSFESAIEGAKDAAWMYMEAR